MTSSNTTAPVSPGDEGSGRHVTVVAPNYPPETNAASQRVGAFSAALRDSGWRVTVLTLAPHHPQNSIYQGYDLLSPSRSVEEGIEVIRIRPMLVPKDRLVLRLLSESLFALQALPHLLRLRPDAVLASSPYMFLGPLGLMAGRLMSVPFVWDVRDLTWLYPAAAGKRTFGLDLLLERFMRATAARATALVTTTAGQHDYFDRRPPLSAVIPNGVSDAWLERLLEIRPPTGQAPPTVVYAGLMGYMHGLDTVVHAAALLPDVRFLLVGDGPEAPRLKELGTSLGLRNLEFRGYLPHDELIEVYRQASVLVSHVRANPIVRWIQAAKVWEYLATGRPVVHASEGESVEVLQAGRLASTVPPEQPAALAAALRWLLDHPDDAAGMGTRARAFVSTQRRRSVLNRRLVGILDGIAPRGR